MKIQAMKLDKIFLNSIFDKESIYKIFKELKQFNSKNIITTFENGQRTSIDISPEKAYCKLTGT
jgi:hypothetical protein